MRKIIKIDEEKCNGCGICVDACHEGALQMVNGKAKLVSESYCDGLGDCLPECPTGAITIEEREAQAFDEQAVKRHMEARAQAHQESVGVECAGIEAFTGKDSSPSRASGSAQSELRQWPCQMKLLPVNAPYFDNAHLLVAADCTAFAYPNIHQDFMKGRVTMIGCPKLDNIQYGDKLTEILNLHDIQSITVLKMEVPCCNGMLAAVKTALQNSGKVIPWSVVTISRDGKIIQQL